MAGDLGTAAPGEEVTVKFRDQEKSTTAGADGKWVVKLDKLTAGGRMLLNNRAAGDQGVLVGDVVDRLGTIRTWKIASKNFVAGDPVRRRTCRRAVSQLRLFSTRGKKIWKRRRRRPAILLGAACFRLACRCRRKSVCPVGLMSPAVGGTPRGIGSAKGVSRDAPAGGGGEICETYDYDAAKGSTPGLGRLEDGPRKRRRRQGKPVPRGPIAR